MWEIFEPGESDSAREKLGWGSLLTSNTVLKLASRELRDKAL